MSNKETLLTLREFSTEKDSALVFLHGFPNNHLLWDQQIEFFKKNFHILNFGLPGSEDGRTFCEDVCSRESLSEEIIQKLESLKGKKIYLIGHDLGCVILDYISRKRPSLAAGLILISGMGLEQFHSRKNHPKQQFKSWYMFFLKHFEVPKFLEGIIRNTIYNISGVPKNSPLRSSAPHGFAPARLYRSFLKEMKTLSLKHFTKSETPSSLIFGRRDIFLNVPSTQEIERFYAKGRLLVLDSGHWPAEADDLNKVIDGLLQRTIT